MNWKVFTAFVVLCSTAVGDDAPNDAERFRGSWRLTSVIVNAKPDESSLGATIRFVDDRILIEPDEPTLFQVRRSEKANEIDLLSDVGNGKPELIARGIYRIDNGKLVLCFAFDKEPFRLCIVGDQIPPRPASFDAKKPIKGYGKAVLTMTRIGKDE